MDRKILSTTIQTNLFIKENVLTIQPVYRKVRTKFNCSALFCSVIISQIIHLSTVFYNLFVLLSTQQIGVYRAELNSVSFWGACDEESLLVDMLPLKEILRFAQNDPHSLLFSPTNYNLKCQLGFFNFTLLTIYSLT